MPAKGWLKPIPKDGITKKVLGVNRTDAESQVGLIKLSGAWIGKKVSKNEN